MAANGSLVYIPGGAVLSDERTVVSLDRQGHPSSLPGLPVASYRDVRVSPDGARLALATQTGLWIYDFTRATLSRPTTDPSARNPLWTPDGQRIVFTSGRAGYSELFWRPSDGTGSDERLLTRAKDLTSLRGNGWSPDGNEPLFTEVAATSAIAQIAIKGQSDAKVLVNSDSPSAISLQTDAGWLTRTTCPVEPRFYVERYPELWELGNKSRPAAAVSRFGRRTAGNCSSAAWTPGGCLRSQCSPGRNIVSGRAAGVVRIRDRPDVGWSPAVRHRPRWTVPDYSQWAGGSR